ncbi:MAG: DUF6527 family protein [Bryobacteraceae bacterium]|jgi:hypothetical protein
MKRENTLVHEFVEFIPDVLKDGTLYVSMEYATVVHKCCCGCGREVVTPLSPTDWKLTYDGKTISLHPSIGNWGFECQSHYWITGNRVRWAPRWSPKKVAAGRARDRAAKERYFDTADAATDSATEGNLRSLKRSKGEQGFWQKLKKWWS